MEIVQQDFIYEQGGRLEDDRRQGHFHGRATHIHKLLEHQENDFSGPVGSDFAFERL